jgi:hypothetical protein
MIDEKYLESAVRIRKNYLKISNNLEFYHRKTKEIISNLESILGKVETLSKELEDGNIQGDDKITREQSVDRLLKILQSLDQQSKDVEELASPLNKEIEKLAVEEQELYRQIKEKYSNITDDNLLSVIKNRLEKEGLS